jgi:hypothetical protein
VEVRIHEIMTSAVGRSASRSCRITPMKHSQVRAGLEDGWLTQTVWILYRTEKCLCWDSNTGHSACSKSLYRLRWPKIVFATVHFYFCYLTTLIADWFIQTFLITISTLFSLPGADLRPLQIQNKNWAAEHNIICAQVIHMTSLTTTLMGKQNKSFINCQQIATEETKKGMRNCQIPTQPTSTAALTGLLAISRHTCEVH